MVYKFADHFWDHDFCGTTGYDTLITRLKDGKKLCDSFTEFLRNRIKIEDEYGKSLQRLGQSSGSNDEVGTLKNSWDAVKKEVQNVGLIHCELSKKLNDVLDRTMKFREQQKNDRNKIDEKMKKYQRDKKSGYENMQRAKKSYEQRTRESEQSKDALDKISSPSAKEEDKLRKNISKSKTQAETADSHYQSTIKTLEDSRKKWQLEMEDACEKFESFEVTRVQFLRNEMWVYANLETMMALNIDQKCQLCREVIEKCDEKADIQMFINTKQTGSERPAPIVYKSFFQNSSPATMVTSQSQNHLSSLGRNVMPPKSNSSSSLPQAWNAKKPDDGIDGINAYASISEIRNCRDGVVRSGNFFRVLFEYRAQGPEELTLMPGDMIELVHVEDDSWAVGTLNGRRGAFPLEFVEKC